jgi:hypothetical protein
MGERLKLAMLNKPEEIISKRSRSQLPHDAPASLLRFQQAQAREAMRMRGRVLIRSRSVTAKLRPAGPSGVIFYTLVRNQTAAARLIT